MNAAGGLAPQGGAASRAWRTLPCLALVSTLAMPAPAWSANWGLGAMSLQVGAGLRFDDNAFTTEADDRERSEGSGEGFAELSLPIRLGSRMLVFVDGSVTGMRFDRYDDLGQEAVTAAARLRVAPSIHFDSWLYELFYRQSVVEVRSDRRDTEMSVTGMLAQRNLGFGNRLTLGADVRRRVSRGAVHDLDDVGVFVNFDRQWNKQWLSYTGYRFLRGDVVSSGRPRLSLLHESGAIEADEVLGGVAADAFLYRLEGDSHVLTAGVNYLLTESLALDLSWRGIAVNAAGDNRYYRNLVQLLALWQVF